MAPPIEVLIVDDSALAREALRLVFEAEEGIEVVGTAPDAYVAASKLRRHAPDVIVLDLEMPRMDGLTFLRKLMEQHPLPVVVCSALAGTGSEHALKALEYGAVEVIPKPRMGPKGVDAEGAVRIADAVRAAAQARLDRIGRRALEVEPKLSADAVLPRPTARGKTATGHQVVCIGASTGGTEVIATILQALPADYPPVVIAQHMPEHFTAAFAGRLDGLAQMRVTEARDGERLESGHAYVAPGDRHVMLVRLKSGYRIELSSGPLVMRHRPSVDVLFRSAAREAGSDSIGVLLTGMGEDGAAGLLEMRQAGAETLVQDEASCVVFGMPYEALQIGAASAALPPMRIVERLMQATERRAAAAHPRA